MATHFSAERTVDSTQSMLISQAKK